jgi:hypothetical protein
MNRAPRQLSINAAVRQRQAGGSGRWFSQEHACTTHLDRNRSQAIAAARPCDAVAFAQFETRAMYRAHQQAVLALEELSWCPVQAATCVRADIEPCAHAVTIAIQDQRFGITIEHRFDFGKAAISDLVEQREDWCLSTM